MALNHTNLAHFSKTLTIKLKATKPSISFSLLLPPSFLSSSLPSSLLFLPSSPRSFPPLPFLPPSYLSSSLAPFLPSSLPSPLPSALLFLPFASFLPPSFSLLCLPSSLPFYVFPCPYSFPSFSFLPPFLSSFPFPFSILAFVLFLPSTHI